MNKLLVLTAALLVFKMCFSQSSDTQLMFDPEYSNNLKFDLQPDKVYQLFTQGENPWIQTKPLTQKIENENVMLSFDYFCPQGINFIQLYFGPEIQSDRLITDRKIGLSEGWVSYSINLSSNLKEWGNPGDFLRIVFGNKSGIQIQLRNLRLRAMTEQERNLTAEHEEKIRREAEMEGRLKKYLNTSYPSTIKYIEVLEKKISVEGVCTSAGQVFLCEVAPYQDVTEKNGFEIGIMLNPGTFKIEFERFIERNSFKYDRLLSKWVIAEKTESDYKILSHAHFPDKIDSKYNLQKEVPLGKKGLGGFFIGRGYLTDLEDLDITSATVNIWFSKFMFLQPDDGRIEHVYNGKSYYFEEDEVVRFDSTFSLTASKGIITAAILLIDKAKNCPDKEVGRLLQHPDMDPSGIYSMPNMTNPASVDCYAAALDFLASRYSRPDKKYGRCNHWIMHNEVDAGWVWTNMGEKSALIFMDTYIKSMRMCYVIVRNYNPHSEVFASLTHYWAWTSHPRFYPSKDLLEILCQYTKTEGDFQWALAHHPYPESLFEPKTWLDKKVDFTFNSPLITFANLEVINAWIKRPEMLYKGKHKRTLWLSENGTNSKTYSEQDLIEQAAGFAYTWKKLKVLDGIDGFQWHNWIDNRNEGGLRIGLRRFPNDETNPGGVKPVWFLYQAADRPNENDVFNQYMELIGIKNWNEVRYTEEIKEK